MTAATENRWSARSEWLFAGLVTVAIVWLHFHFWRIAGGLWRDEVNLVNLAQSPSFAAMTHDSFPVLMPLLVKIWSAVLGGTDERLRFLGMALGLAIPVAFWVVAWTTRRPPVFSVTLFGLNSLMICYGDSLRGYGLGAALVVLALAGTRAVLLQPTWPRAALLALAATLSVQALYQNAILFFAICLGAFAVCWREKNSSAALKIFCAGAVAAISLLPYHAAIAALPEGALELRHGISPAIVSLTFQMATGFPFDQFVTVWKGLVIITVGAAAVSLWRVRGERPTDRDSLSLLAGTTVAAIAVLFMGFLWFASVTARPWYFLPPLAVAAACFDFGISPVTLPRLARMAVVIFLLGTALSALPMARTDLRGHFTNVDRLAARVAAEASPQDFVVVTPWFCGISFDRYFHGAPAWTTLPPLADHRLHRYDLVLMQMKDTNTLATVFERISTTLRGGHRVWVVGLLNLPPPDAVEPPVLPPPPLKESGWSDTPYTASWAARTGFYLARHAVRIERASKAADEAGVFQEDLQLLVAEGWRP